jgi:hypothetical protein
MAQRQQLQKMGITGQLLLTQLKMGYSKLAPWVNFALASTGWSNLLSFLF